MLDGCGPLFNEDEDENECGVILSISKFIVIADNMAGVLMYEIVLLGTGKFMGEVIRLEGDHATIQVYEETSGLQVGDAVVRTKAPLSVELGPGILDQMYDGIQRPLEEMGRRDGIFLEKGAKTPALDRSKLWEFEPSNFRIGDHITGGDIFGRVSETQLVVHWIMLPPKAKGTITYIAPPGHYTVTEEVLRVEFMGTQQSFTMMHKWPVRQPRPYDEKQACDTPLFTGFRVYDALFPLAIGGTCVFPGAFGCGKTVTCYSIATCSNSDVVVYVGCGERGNELCGTLMEYPEVSTNVGGVTHSVMKRMCVIGNTSDMPMAAREASIYTGVTTSEYFRDQGYNATMIADSTSRWAEAVEEISSISNESSASLGSRLASFYERAGKVSCLGNPARTGAVTILGAVSPPGGDFNDPFTASTLSICQVFWGLDKKLAHRRHFPSVNWNLSHSRYIDHLAPFYDNIDADYSTDMAKIKQILRREDELIPITQTTGRNSLQEGDKLTLEIAALIREDFLQQNTFGLYDRVCPHYKTSWMMKNIVLFYSLALGTLSPTMPYTKVKSETRDVLCELSRMKFMDPAGGRDIVEQGMRTLNADILLSFSAIGDN